MLAGPGRRRARDSPPAVTRTNEEPPAMSTIDTAATPTMPPHGGVLVDLLLARPEAERAAEEAEHLPKVAIGQRELSDLEMMAVGALSPLTGFMAEKDYRLVI